MAELFPDLPQFPPALPDGELRFLADLPQYDTVQAVPQEMEATCRRLERLGLVKVHRWKDDPAGTLVTLYAGRLPAAGIREARRG